LSTDFIEKLEQVALVTVFAMGIVFAVLIVITGITIFRTYILKERKKNIQTEVDKDSSVPISNTLKSEPVDTVHRSIKEVANDEEIAAAIVAAICAYTNSSSSDFVIKSIKRVDNSVPAWRRSGII
jgi:glutaconyl-CoA/methylmalonyl-CoA decarboxylase subunit delta